MGGRVSLVTGATGLLARRLVPALVERGDSVHALVLPNEDTAWLDALGVVVSRGDVRDAVSVRRAIAGVDTVFHLAAIHGLRRPREEYYSVNVGGTNNVCRAVLDAGIRRLVHVSTWNVYGSGHRRPVDETQPLRPMRDDYALSKARADLLVQSLIREEGLPAVIVRPGTMIGPGDRVNFSRLAERLRAGKMIVIGSGKNALPLVYVDDVARGLVLASESDAAVGRAYNIANDCPITQEECLHAIARAVGAEPPRLRVPLVPLYAAGYVSEIVAELLGGRMQPLVTRLGVAQFGHENRFSIDMARRDLGYEPKVGVSEAIRLTADWYNASLLGESKQGKAEMSAGSGTTRTTKSTQLS